MLLGTLGASLLESLLTGKGMIANMPGCGTTRAGERTIRAVENF